MENISIFGFNWIVGRQWGIAHPDSICYNGKQSIFVNPEIGFIQLGIDHDPTDIPIPDHYDPKNPDVERIKHYEWSVGYLSSVESIKYGYLRVMFKLPIGNHLLPAIWLADCKTWPPEIDIVEGWTGTYNWPIFKPKTPHRLYRVNPFANGIFPGVHLGTNPKKHWGKSYTKFRGTSPCYLNITNYNICELIWTPERLLTFYNGHKVMDESDPAIIKYYNNSDGMCIHLNNYITNDFTVADYIEMEQKKNSGYDKQFRIIDLAYDPNYKQFLIGTKYES